MSILSVALIEWSDPADLGGPRLIGSIADPDVVELVRERLAAARRRELVRLEQPVRPFGAGDGETSG